MKTRKGVLSLLLVLAMLTVAFAALVSVTTAADPAEIQNFGYQRVVGDSVASASTQLRFIFTIGTLDYTRAGFVFSLTNHDPTVDGDDCYVYEATEAYRSITADDVTTPAPNDRWWIAVKLTAIPHSYFAGTFYLRAFVLDGGGVRYSDVKAFTVCSALGHRHAPLPWDAPGTATMQTPGTLSGHCNGCNLDHSLSDVKRDPVIYDSKNPGGPFNATPAFCVTMAPYSGDPR